MLQKVIFSGIQPSGVPHVGNYFGAIRQWLQLQETVASRNELIISVVDLHALTSQNNGRQLRQNTTLMAKYLLACGLDPSRATLFRQSDLAGPHLRLAWILQTCATVARLQQLTHWKEKSSTNPSAANLTYPVLQAADILLYRATTVPVGEDQTQNVRIVNEIREKFAKRYPDARDLFPHVNMHTDKADDSDKFLARIRDLRHPERKMSKTGGLPAGRIELSDSDEAVRKKIASAVTDSLPGIGLDFVNRPGVSALVTLHAAVSRQAPTSIAERYSECRKGDYKKEVTEAVLAMLRPIREKAERIEDNVVEAALAEGARTARTLAEETLQRVTHIVGVS